MIHARRLVLVACALGCGSRSATAVPDDDDAAPHDVSVDPDDAAAAPSDATPVRRDRPTHAIYRDEVDRAVGRGPGHLLRQLGPEPFRHHGQFVGWSITRLFPDDPELCAAGCDIALGDVILSVNGSRLETPGQLAEAFERLPQTNRLVVHSLREGRRREVTYTILDP